MQPLQLHRPYAMMMVGIPGSGKSYFAEKFADTFHAPYIDSLELESRAKDSDAASQLIGYTLGELAKSGKSFLFEGNSDTRIRRTEFAAWARSRGYTPLFIWVQTDPATALGRTLRTKSLGKEEFERAVRNFSAPHDSEKAVVVSGKHTYASQAKVVLKRLSSDNRPASESHQPSERSRSAASSSRSISVSS